MDGGEVRMRDAAGFCFDVDVCIEVCVCVDVCACLVDDAAVGVAIVSFSIGIIDTIYSAY